METSKERHVFGDELWEGVQPGKEDVHSRVCWRFLGGGATIFEVRRLVGALDVKHDCLAQGTHFSIDFFHECCLIVSVA